jgi:hypothetical protein
MKKAVEIFQQPVIISYMILSFQLYSSNLQNENSSYLDNKTKDSLSNTADIETTLKKLNSLDIRESQQLEEKIQLEALENNNVLDLLEEEETELNQVDIVYDMLDDLNLEELDLILEKQKQILKKPKN